MAGIIEIDVHGKDVETAIREIKKHLNNAGTGTYRIRIIHGYHGNTPGSRELAALVGQNGANRGIWESGLLLFYYE